MDYTNELFARLQRGENVDALASELTKAINEANNRYIAEQEAKRKAEQEAKMKAAADEASRNDKIKAIKALIAAIEGVLVEWDLTDSDTLDEIEKLDAAEIVDEIDKAIPAIQEYMELMAAIQGAREKYEAQRSAPAPAGRPNGDTDPIEKFLNQFVR